MEIDITEWTIYSVLALEARKRFIELLLRQDKEIQTIFQEIADSLADEIKGLEIAGQSGRILEVVDNKLVIHTQVLEARLKKLFDEGIKFSVEAGMYQSKEATLSLLNRAKIDWKPIERAYYRKHVIAVEEMQNRIIRGLNLSDRIWEQSQKTRRTLGTIVREAIAAGEHPYKVAELLEIYVREGAQTIVAQYPNMVERLEGNIPMDMSYESLRLARTESAAAFGAGVRTSAELNPSSKGIQWRTSNAGNVCSVCVEIANRDVGLGKGVYPLHLLPEYPAHPNCLCVLSEVVEDTDDFIDRLLEWQRNPLSQPDIERWYQNVYKQGMIA